MGSSQGVTVRTDRHSQPVAVHDEKQFSLSVAILLTIIVMFGFGAIGALVMFTAAFL